MTLSLFIPKGDSGGPLVQKAGGKAAGDQWTQVTSITHISFITYIYISIIDNLTTSSSPVPDMRHYRKKLGWIPKLLES